VEGDIKNGLKAARVNFTDWQQGNCCSQPVSMFLFRLRFERAFLGLSAIRATAAVNKRLTFLRYSPSASIG
jgi:hypothetical protein